MSCLCDRVCGCRSVLVCVCDCVFACGSVFVCDVVFLLLSLSVFFMIILIFWKIQAFKDDKNSSRRQQDRFFLRALMKIVSNSLCIL